MTTHPYKGLQPYEEQDQDNFFGRDADKRILLDKILGNKLTLLFAASGVGKSSLLQAAIMPALRKRGNLELVYFRDWVARPAPAVATGDCRPLWRGRACRVVGAEGFLTRQPVVRQHDVGANP